MLNISIVLYNPDIEQVTNLVSELLRVRCLHGIYLLDNSPIPSALLASFSAEHSVHGAYTPPFIRYMPTGSNLGYGRAHNIALRQSIEEDIPYHLVMNADILVHAEDIDRLHTFMETNPVVGSLMPRVTYPDGSLQYLCKLLPAPLDVFGRRFLPKRWMKKRNERYELRHTRYDHPMNVPYLSGCFMLLRTVAARQAGLFDERYFMYPEDIDLTRTIHRNWLTVYMPSVTIVHNHAQASYHSWRMTWIHIVNLCRYFNKYGWIFDKERRLMNRLTINNQ